MTFDEALDKYYEQFNEHFPVIETRLDGDELIKVIQECLNNNKKYEVEYSKDITY